MTTDSVIVEASRGAMRGAASDGASNFFAVPYAADPIGDLRFAAPIPPKPWAGVRDATQRGPSVPQGRSRLAAVMGEAPPLQSEAGSLTLNSTLR